MAAVKPRDAASLLLFRSASRSVDVLPTPHTIRQVSESVEVLVGRRPSRSRFMPDVYVFPGGAVDATDARAKPARPLNKAYTAHMAVGNSHARAQTMGMAVVRETLEETGLAITSAGYPGRINDDTWQALAEQGVSADLSVLKYFARATTPPDQPIRFHARFFACRADDVAGLDTNALKQNDELLDLRWVRIDKSEDLPLRTVTRFLLREFCDWLNPPRQGPGYPAFTQRAGKPVVTRSHDRG